MTDTHTKMGFATRAISDLGFCLPRGDNWQAWILLKLSREKVRTRHPWWEIITTRNNGCYLLRPHRPRDRRPQGGRPPHLRARGRLRPPHPVRLLRQGFRPPRVRIPVIPSRGFCAEFFPWFIESDERPARAGSGASRARASRVRCGGVLRTHRGRHRARPGAREGFARRAPRGCRRARFPIARAPSLSACG